jgi:SAM-dependent methyltransferase
VPLIDDLRAIARRVLPRPVRATITFARVRIATAAAGVWDSLSPPREPWPVPPAKLRFRVQGGVSRSAFLATGRQCAGDIHRALTVISRPFESFSAVLDFGCGVGRVIRWLGPGHASLRLHGADIDGEAIEWCRGALPFAEFSTTLPEPPLRFSDGQFDLVYGISVFTHLDEALQFAWLRELKRVTRPRGLLLLTIHGPSLHPQLRNEERRTIERNDFVFRCEITGALKPDGLPDFYQVTFHSRQYVEQRWGELFRIVAFIERGMAGYQDLVVLEPR